MNRAEVVSLSATSVTLYLCSFLVEASSDVALVQVFLTVFILVVNISVMAWFVAIITRVGTESILKLIGAMDPDEHEV